MVLIMTVFSLLFTCGVSMAQSSGGSSNNVSELAQQLQRLRLQTSNPTSPPHQNSASQTPSQQNTFQKTPPPPLKRQEKDLYGK